MHTLLLLKKKDDQHELQLIFHDDLIELYDLQLDTTISVDFIKGNLAHRQEFGGGRGQAIAKAVGLKSGNTPSVLDATAGLAGDAFVLATLGCSMTLIERSPIIFTLIENAVERGVNVRILAFNGCKIDSAKVYHHKPLEENESTARWITIVRDGREALTGQCSGEGGMVAAWTRNKCLVFISKQYIEHEIIKIKGA